MSTRTSSIIILLLCAAGASHAQTPPANDTLAQLAAYIGKVGHYTRMNGPLTTRIDHRAQASDRCTLVIEARSSSSMPGSGGFPVEMSTKSVTPLGRLSPEVTIETLPTVRPSAVAVGIGGDSVITSTVSNPRGGRKSGRLQKLIIGADTREQADTVATLLAGAIRACAGSGQ